MEYLCCKCRKIFKGSNYFCIRCGSVICNNCSQEYLEEIQRKRFINYQYTGEMYEFRLNEYLCSKCIPKEVPYKPTKYILTSYNSLFIPKFLR